MLSIVSIIFVLIAFVSGGEVCYTNLELGCFTNNRPFGGTFQRPLSLLPDSPTRIATKFTLFNKLHPEGTVINASVLSDKFVPSFKTKFITHGFVHNDIKQWVFDMRKAMIRAEDVNVITVDWSKGNGLPYTQATANTQVVGREIAKLINSLCEKTSIVAEDFHLIGHSLGAHVSGYAGERLKSFYSKNLGRITGLDTAGPYFENTDPIVRLDPTDAKFVDAIHTDGEATIKLGLGLYQMVGDVGFYPNGGMQQPGCPVTSGKLLNAIFSLATLDYESVENGVACSHSASFHFFIDSIKNKCKYTAYPCNSKEDFEKGVCIKCGDKGCNRMGYWASPEKNLGMLFLNTQSPLGESFCKQNYKITLVSDNINGLVQTRGLFELFFITKNHQSSTHVLDDSQTTFKQDSTEERFISLDSPIDEEIESLFISFKKTTSLISGWLYYDQWSFKYIEVFNGDTQLSARFCPYVSIIDSGKTVRFSKC